jgi:hypothetical protein
MAHPTHKVVKDIDAPKPFTFDTFSIVEFTDRIPRTMEVVEEGSHEECEAFIRLNAHDPSSPTKKKIKKK